MQKQVDTLSNQGKDGCCNSAKCQWIQTADAGANVPLVPSGFLKPITEIPNRKVELPL